MQGKQLAEWRERVRAAVGAGDGDNHDPCRTSHDHYHIHGLDSDVQGLDSNGGHAHMHAHGKKPDSLHPLSEDNDHGHDHQGMEFDPGDDPGNPGLEREDGLPGTSAKDLREIRAALAVVHDGGQDQRTPRGRHIRFAGGRTVVLNSAARSEQDRRVDAAFARAAAFGKQVA